jgi:predicted AAA+ superfamily ATPase
MIERKAWIRRIEKSWEERRVLWLCGPRRLGKTTLSKSLEGVLVFDCAVPSVRRDVEDSEAFLAKYQGKRIILDEIHRLSDPSGLLKLASDHYPETCVLATGSSTLGASARFRDTLAGRKRTIHMRPVLASELGNFGIPMEHRLLQGGLPENLLSATLPEKDFSEWTDAYWARDILDLFSVGKRYSFLKFLELLWVQSAGMCSLSTFTSACEASRQTLANYLDIFEATGVVQVLRPYSTNPSREIISMPKVYGFDTGFVCHARGISSLRPDDMGVLWEHLVLDELSFHLGDEQIHYWRDKQKHEVDFVWAPRGRPPVAVECKWRSATKNLSGLKSFSTLHPDAARWVVTADRSGFIETERGGIRHVECGVDAIPGLIAAHRRSGK